MLPAKLMTVAWHPISIVVLLLLLPMLSGVDANLRKATSPFVGLFREAIDRRSVDLRAKGSVPPFPSMLGRSRVGKRQTKESKGSTTKHKKPEEDTHSNSTTPKNTDDGEPSAGCKTCTSSLKFAHAAKYEVGNQIPSLPFKTKTSWAGNMPVGEHKNGKERAFYFWLWGKDGINDKDTDLVIWLNGGPGCSSLGGMTQELGPWNYKSKKEGAKPNPYSWTRAAHMLFVEQPIGTGFTIGAEATLTDETDVAIDFDAFLTNFFVTFPELKGRRLYMAGESYAGQYIPHIMAWQYEHDNKHNVVGGLIGDGLFAEEPAQQDLVTYDVAVRMKKTLKFDDFDLQPLQSRASKCNYTGFVKEHLNYPPKGVIPTYDVRGCFAFYSMLYYAKLLTPNFNVYNIKKPHDYDDDPLGPISFDPFDPKSTFFDSPAVQKYIHAPSKKWNVCNEAFKHVDGSQEDKSGYAIPSGVMKKAVEKSERFTLFSGGLDMLLATEGIQLVIQNLTWHGKQGFR